jgi:glucuronate isomerase
LEP